MNRPALFWTVLVGILATAFTAFTIFVPSINVAYFAPTGRLIMETTSFFCAAVAALLVFGRFAQDRLTNDFILVFGLLLLAFDKPIFAVLGPISPEDARQVLATWALLASALLGSAMFLVAALAPERKSPGSTGIAAAYVVVGAAAVTFIIGGAALLLSDVLPVGINASATPDIARPRIVGHPALLVAQLALAAYFAVAAIGFARRADRRGSALLAWFGAGSMLAAFARVNYFVFPTLYSDYVSAGDVLRIGFYLMLLVGSAHEITRYWRGLAEAAVLEERRRIARDLHDGVAQELAYIWSRSKLLRSPEVDELEADRISASAERALDESRRAIAALTRPVDESLDIALAQTVEEIAKRSGADVRLELEADVSVPLDTREALLKIAREAVNNAIRHGQADTVTVKLEQTDRLTLSVVDDGRGFDPEDRSDRSGFGLISMRERAEQLGAEFRVLSKIGSGSRVEVELP